MSDNSRLMIAVASDFHAHDETIVTKPPSWLNINQPASNKALHPTAGLVDLISSSDLRADWLLCPGDLTHQAKPAPLNFAWAELQRISNKLKTTLVAATAGNHDMDSRYRYNNHDAKGMLLAVGWSALLDAG